MAQDKKLFFSYGHDDYVKYVLKVKEYLEKEGFEVFFDAERLDPSLDWDHELEKGLITHKKVIFFITRHSARRPNGFCLNELSMALVLNNEIIPVLLENHVPPLSIVRKQFLDMTFFTQKKDVDDKLFLEKMARLIKVLNGEQLDSDGIQQKVFSELNPIDFTQDFERHRQFIGRKWIIDKVDNWMIEHPKSKVFWITAEAGYGKSALAAYLANRHPDVVGIHFCSYNYPNKNKPTNVIKTLAYHFQSQIDGYLDEIANIKTEDKNVFELYEQLIANPLSSVESKGKNFIFIIDALDETLEDKELVELIGSEEFQLGLPDYVKIIITSRQEPRLTQTLSRLNPVILDTQQEDNKNDCIEYVKVKLTELGYDNYVKNKEFTNALLEKSSANMLYLTMFFYEVQEKLFDMNNLENFPKGLNGIYESFFKRITKDEDKYDDVYAPLLEVILAYGEAIPKATLQDILGYGLRKFSRAIGKIGAILKENDSKVYFYHKSIGEWLVNEENVSYLLDVKEGQQRIYNFANKLNIDDMSDDFMHAFSTVSKSIKNHKTRVYDNLFLQYISNNEYTKSFSGLFQEDIRLKSLYNLCDKKRINKLIVYLIEKKRNCVSINSLSKENMNYLYHYFGIFIPAMQINDEKLILSIFDITKSLYGLVHHAETLTGETSTTFHSRVIYDKFLEKVINYVEPKFKQNFNEYESIYEKVVSEFLKGYYLFHQIDRYKALYLTEEMYKLSRRKYGKDNQKTIDYIDNIFEIEHNTKYDYDKYRYSSFRQF